MSPRVYTRGKRRNLIWGISAQSTKCHPYHNGSCTQEVPQFNEKEGTLLAIAEVLLTQMALQRDIVLVAEEYKTEKSGMHKAGFMQLRMQKREEMHWETVMSISSRATKITMEENLVGQLSLVQKLRVHGKRKPVLFAQISAKKEESKTCRCKIYSKNEKELKNILRTILECLKKEQLYLSFFKFEFGSRRSRKFQRLLSMTNYSVKKQRSTRGEKEENAFSVIKAKSCALSTNSGYT
ncbi:hypothetical protein Tco_0386270 [Tanacetum coccineum]